MKIVLASDGTTEVTLSTINGQLTDITPPQNSLKTYTGPDLQKKYTLPGAAFEGTRAFALKNGRAYSQSYINSLFPAATVASITPATGSHLSTTPVVIKGQNLGGVTAITVGGTAATAVSVVDDQTVNATFPTNAAAGAQNVVLTDDSGTTTVTAGFLYS